ncbi:SCP-like extracellular protein, partial [Morchella snyderi]
PTTSLSTRADAAADPSFTDDARFQSELLAHHNRLRAEHTAEQVSWDPELARTAAGLADTCVYGHSVSLDLNAARNGGPYGENIALGYPTVRDTCYAWGEAERASYTPAEYEHPSYNSRMGHFTQVVWVATQRVGCARKLCDGKWFMVCEYSPRGNIRAVEYYRKNVLPPV